MHKQKPHIKHENALFSSKHSAHIHKKVKKKKLNKLESVECRIATGINPATIDIQNCNKNSPELLYLLKLFPLLKFPRSKPPPL